MPLSIGSALMRVITLAAVLIGAGVTVPLAQQLSGPVGATLTAEAAKPVMAAAVAEAAKQKWPVVITIVDRSGQTVLTERLPQARDFAVGLAEGKARTALTFRRPTQEIHDQLVASGWLKRQWLTRWTFRGATVLGGGLPIFAGGQLIGGIGVSGVAPDDDVKVALAGVAGMRR